MVNILFEKGFCEKYGGRISILGSAKLKRRQWANLDVCTLLCWASQLGCQLAVEVLVYRGAVMALVDIIEINYGPTAIVDAPYIKNQTDIKNFASSPVIHFCFISFSHAGCTVVIKIHPSLIGSCPVQPLCTSRF